MAEVVTAAWERPDLASYAARSSESRGRRYEEDLKDDRPAFERDRDRIIHCSAFRRLEYKTQVFVNHEGDYYRTRLTHSLEVAQIARSIARRLRLNEDLTETIALAHDLGHTPFGHSGEVMLHELMQGNGGFEHNLQSLRVVEILEERYPRFPGLNLTWETREGLVKRTPVSSEPGDTIPAEYDPKKHPTLEAQIIDLADEIAYNNHDIDDGLQSGLIEDETLRQEVALWAEVIETTRKKNPSVPPPRKKYYAISHLIGYLILDLVDATEKNISRLQISTPQEVREAPQRLVTFSRETGEKNQHLKSFLMENLYNHYRVKRMSSKAKMVVAKLFTAYNENPLLLPKKHQRKMENESRQRIICDYIAGMTDRYALSEYRKLFDPFAKV
jgi:dGTPase